MPLIAGLSAAAWLYLQLCQAEDGSVLWGGRAA